MILLFKHTHRTTFNDSNFLPILYGLTFMSLLGISLNMTTLMVGSICLGLVVDDSIHFSQISNIISKKKRKFHLQSIKRF